MAVRVRADDTHASSVQSGTRVRHAHLDRAFRVVVVVEAVAVAVRMCCARAKAASDRTGQFWSCSVS